ncbi:hypothetical protein M409DRAFT_29390 [Zasmidium cellare ATCC 36951]|uniref:Beta-lactamase-related domain-containing protein n=1 Tax=Zasmidium cellare ATCC 36951 TaxID=1080233 RepID=A0A6A6C2K7_ZASCE|nr:uncharacterized protein M409DRAFT_29390 [Zasmidium cellare ATCC 36951]KAF2160092.1 hypothetical protein M409DRAFT_29390 [Zasmidium cellare ATCC 36951]
MPSTRTSPFTDHFGFLVHETIKKWKVPGLAFSVIHEDQEFSKAYGLANIEKNESIDVDKTVFNVGSTTKAQLCAAWAIYINSESNTMKLKKDQVGWKTPLAQIIPADFILPDPIHAQQVTLEDVLCHKSGMVSHDLAYGWGQTRTPRDVTRNLRNLALKSLVRSEWSYCNIGYGVATHALEVLTGKALTEYLREELWVPLGMKSTFGGIQDLDDKNEAERLAKGYTWSRLPVDEDWEQGGFELSQPQDISPVSGAGYINSTTSSYLVVQSQWSPPFTTPFEGGHVQYALGWFVGVLHGFKVLYHTGGSIGYGAMVMLVPECRWAAVMLGNEFNTGLRVASLVFELFEVSLGIPEHEHKAFMKTDEAVAARERLGFSSRETRLEALFPDAPSRTSIPPALPLASYAGAYFNPGYGPLTLTVSEGEDIIRCEITDRTWPVSIKIQHVNAEHWFFEQTNGNREIWKAESKIGVNGEVERFGVAIDGTSADHLVWFDRLR